MTIMNMPEEIRMALLPVLNRMTEELLSSELINDVLGTWREAAD